MSHFVVVIDWTSEGDNGCNVLGVEHSLEKAKEIFKDAVEAELDIAANNGWTIYEHNDCEFDAGEDGCCADNHSRIFIQEVI